jgi:hypothetical protein
MYFIFTNANGDLNSYLRDHSINQNAKINAQLEEKLVLIEVASFACVGVIISTGLITAFMLNKLNQRSHKVIYFFVQISKSIKKKLLHSVTMHYEKSLKNSGNLKDITQDQDDSSIVKELGKKNAIWKINKKVSQKIRSENAFNIKDPLEEE